MKSSGAVQAKKRIDAPDDSATGLTAERVFEEVEKFAKETGSCAVVCLHDTAAAFPIKLSVDAFGVFVGGAILIDIRAMKTAADIRETLHEPPHFGLSAAYGKRLGEN